MRSRLPIAFAAALAALVSSTDLHAQAPPPAAAQPAQPAQPQQAAPGQPAPGQQPPAQPYRYPPPQAPPYGAQYPYPYPYSYPYPYQYPPPYAYPPPPPPETMRYEEGKPIPRGYHLESRINRGLAIAGGAVFLGAWGISALTAGTIVSENNHSGAEPLFIPVVGPFITMGTSALEWSKNDDRPGLELLALDGIAQTIGVALFIVGMASSNEILVRDHPQASAVPKLAIGPTHGSATWTF